MAQVKRFFHIRPGNSGMFPRGGATVLVTGEDDGGPVRVQVAYCSINDQFSRKQGRERAANSSFITIPLKGLPGMLHKVAVKMMRKQRHPINGYPGWRENDPVWKRDFSFSMKYFKPRLVHADNPEVGHGGAPAQDINPMYGEEAFLAGMRH